MSDVTTYLIGVYIGLGIAFGLWFYLSDDPIMREESRVVKAFQSIVFAVFWLPFLGIAAIDMATD